MLRKGDYLTLILTQTQTGCGRISRWTPYMFSLPCSCWLSSTKHKNPNPNLEMAEIAKTLREEKCRDSGPKLSLIDYHCSLPCSVLALFFLSHFILKPRNGDWVSGLWAIGSVLAHTLDGSSASALSTWPSFFTSSLDLIPYPPSIGFALRVKCTTKLGLITESQGNKWPSHDMATANLLEIVCHRRIFIGSPRSFESKSSSNLLDSRPLWPSDPTTPQPHNPITLNPTAFLFKLLKRNGKYN